MSVNHNRVGYVGVEVAADHVDQLRAACWWHGPGSEPDPAAAGTDPVAAHQPRHPMPADVVATVPEFFVDPWVAVVAEPQVDLSDLGEQDARRAAARPEGFLVLASAPVVVARPGHTQDLAHQLEVDLWVIGLLRTDVVA